MADNKQDREVDKKILVIFESLNKSNVPSNIYMNILKDTKNAKLAQYLPKKLLEDSIFIKELIDNKLINYYDVPKQFQNSEYMSKKYYESQLERGCVSLEKDIYPQDKSIIISAIKGDVGSSKDFQNFNFVKEEHLNDKLYAYEMVLINKIFITRLPKMVVKELFKDTDLICEILKKDHSFYYNIPESDKTKKEYLMIMLDRDDSMGYLMVRLELKKVKDEEVTLLAVKKYTGTLNYIHQNYSRAIVSAGQEDNAYNFLKNYFLNKKMDKELPNATVRVKPNKM